MTAPDPMAFVGLVVVAAGPPVMTGERDLDEQDRELADIYGIEARP